MPETKWTDGPWTARMYAGGYGGWWDIRDDDGEIIVPSVQVEADRPERAEAIARLIAAAPAMAEVIDGYEQWEAELILCQEAWDGGMAPLPTLTEELWDGLLSLQAKRNAVKAQGVTRSLCDKLRAAPPADGA